MKKLLITFLFVIITLPAFAGGKVLKPNFDSVIRESGVDKATISVSIKNLETGKIVYALNDKILSNPASVQKLLTTPAIVDTLGMDYEFKTQLYQRNEGEYLIKLGADPYLASSDLKSFAEKMKRDTKQVYIDDRILDNKTWGEGWQWDDYMNVLMPRFSSYNLDKNLIKLTIVPSDIGMTAIIVNPSKYPLMFANNVKTSKKTNNVTITKDYSSASNIYTLNGTVSEPTIVTIPVPNIQQYFNFQLTKVMESRKVYVKSNFAYSTPQSGDVLLDEISNPIEPAIKEILKSSSNFMSETLFKLAGAKHADAITGTDLLGIKMFDDYCKKINIDNSKVKIVDASGVSKNNLVSADFISEFLYVNKDNETLQNLPIPGEGTLTHRMLVLKESLKAKTGTLSNVSSIAGYLTSRKGNKYAFCIITNDTQLTGADKKLLEDYLIREAYLKL